VLLLTHGFDSDMIAGLVDEGLATGHRELVTASGRTTIEVVRIRISDAGRQALEGSSERRPSSGARKRPDVHSGRNCAASGTKPLQPDAPEFSPIVSWRFFWHEALRSAGKHLGFLRLYSRPLAMVSLNTPLTAQDRSYTYFTSSCSSKS
jgi:hypothetical protein